MENDFRLYRPLYSPVAYLFSGEEALRIYYKFFPKGAKIDTQAMEWALQTELQIRHFCQTRLDIPAKPLPELDVPEDFVRLVEGVDATGRFPRLCQVSSALAKQLLDLSQQKDDRCDHHDVLEHGASL
jgi:hypothetical protein